MTSILETPKTDPSTPGSGPGRTLAVAGIGLAKANRDILTGALHAAWKLRVDKNAATRSGGRTRRPRR